jgi:hypothetical protein
LANSGELDALKSLKATTKINISPVIQIFDSRSIEKFLAFCLNDWNFTGNQIYVDFSLLGYSLSKRELKTFFDKLLNNNVNIIPVIDQNSPREYQIVIKEYLLKNKFSEVALRYYITKSSDNSNAFLQSVLTNYELDYFQIHLFIDAQYIDDKNFNVIKNETLSQLSLITNLNYLNNVIISSGSFPKDLSKLEAKAEPHLLKRYESTLWKNLISDPSLRDVLSYSDYGTRHPIYYEKTVSFPGTCSVRYTYKDKFAVYRGELSSNNELGNKQYIVHSQNLVNSKYYYGVPFSEGDLKIDQIANQDYTVSVPKPKTGNPMQWVSYSLSHHFELIEATL